MSVTTCSCGDPAPHVIAKRTTSDGIGVEIWHDGAVTGRLGRALPGVTCVRPRTVEAVERERRASLLLADEVSLYDLAEVPRLYECARRVAAKGGGRREMLAAFAADDKPALRLTWCVYATDATGTPTVRVAQLDRMRWPGLVVWHERGRYELMTLQRGAVTGNRSREALHPTGFSFGSQRDLRDHLFNVQPNALEVAQ